MDTTAVSQAITVNGLTRMFTVGRRGTQRTIRAVDDITFSVEQGERLAFIGPNGAGKSTSIKMLTGILHPTAGRATVLGLTPWDQRTELARRIGTVFGQRSQLWSELPARASYKMLAAIYGLSDEQLRRRLDELGRRLNAQDLFDQPSRTLSLGQRMRCELAACMLHSPDLLFLDEPSIGLDLVAKQQFRQLLVEVNQELGCTIFLTSHDVADIEHVADRAIIVNHGVIIYDDSVQAMARTLLRTKQVEVSFAAPVEATRLHTAISGAGSAAGNGIAVVEATSTSARLEVDTTAQPVGQVLHRLLKVGSVIDLNVTDPPLDQVISEIYQRPLDVDH